MNTESVESYLRDGCGRCERYQTPQCKVHRWPDELSALRQLLVDCGLEEAMKWGSPCYMIDGKNVLMLTSLVDACALSFFKGAALDDKDGLLEAPGPSSRYARYLKFRGLDEVEDRREQTKKLVQQAIAFARSGEKFVPDGPREPMPEELEERLAGDAVLREAFEALTPGRQRSYFIYIGGAKRSATRERRVEKAVPKIMAGKGFNEY